MSKLIFLVLILNILGLILSSDDCKTPIECYTNAIAQLKKAREEYRQASDKLEKMIESVKSETQGEVAKLQNDINSKVSQVSSSVSQLDQKVNSVSVDIVNKAVKQCEFIVCKVNNWGPSCRCPGNKKILTGGCQIPDSPYQMQMSQLVDPMTWSCSHVGAGGSTVEIHIVCCDIPLY